MNLSTITLGYGARQIPFDFDSNRFQVLVPHNVPTKRLTDAELNTALDAPIGTPPLEKLLFIQKPDNKS